jgi:hypothetical protein
LQTNSGFFISSNDPKGIQLSSFQLPTSKWNTSKLVIKLNPAYQEMFIAGLDGVECEGFQQDEDEVTAYFTKEQFSLQDRGLIERLLSAYRNYPRSMSQPTNRCSNHIHRIESFLLAKRAYRLGLVGL